MPDPNLQAAALRYAAGDLAPDEAAAFEARLSEDQDARDALAEAVRLSARAIGQAPPAPHPSFRALARARLHLGLSRGRQLACAVLGAGAVAACALVAASLEGPREAGGTAAAPPVVAAKAPPAAIEAPPEAAPAPRDAAPSANGVVGEADRSVAEIWADLSTADHVEKARDDELRWRHRLRELSHPQHVSATVKAVPAADVREP